MSTISIQPKMNLKIFMRPFREERRFIDSRGGQTEVGIWTEVVVEMPMGTQKQGVSHHQLPEMSNVGIAWQVEGVVA